MVHRAMNIELEQLSMILKSIAFKLTPHRNSCILYKHIYYSSLCFQFGDYLLRYFSHLDKISKIKGDNFDFLRYTAG